VAFVPEVALASAPHRAEISRMTLFGLLLSALPALSPVQSGEPSHPAPPAALSQAELEDLTAEIRAQVETLRDRKFSGPVAVALADRETFFDYALEREAKTSSAAQRRMQQLELELLGALDANVDLRKLELEILSKQVGGFYDPTRDSFYLMNGFTKPVARVILSHELTHALDDQLYDIDGTLARCSGSLDAQLAFQAVVEGSGMAVMRQWMGEEIKARRLSLTDLQNAPGMSMDGLDRAPEALWKPLLCAYLQGAAFLAKSDQTMAAQRSNVLSADIEHAFRAPPRSTEQVLHPEKYWDETRRDEPRAVHLSHALLPDGWSELGQDTLGEVGLALVTTPRDERSAVSLATLLAPKFTNAAARGWDGDRCAVFENGGAAVLVLHTVWDTVADADEFASAWSSLQQEVDANLAARVATPAGVAPPDGVATPARASEHGTRAQRIGASEVAVWCWSGCAAAEQAKLEALLSVRVDADPLPAR
jgi:hypothetical protein